MQNKYVSLMRGIIRLTLKALRYPGKSQDCSLDIGKLYFNHCAKTTQGEKIAILSTIHVHSRPFENEIIEMREGKKS